MVRQFLKSGIVIAAALAFMGAAQAGPLDVGPSDRSQGQSFGAAPGVTHVFYGGGDWRRPNRRRARRILRRCLRRCTSPSPVHPRRIRWCVRRCIRHHQVAWWYR